MLFSQSGGRMAEAALPTTTAPPRPRWRLHQELILVLLVAAEVALFSAIGKNFLTAGNGFEIVRLGVEVGLLALALTPVIVSGGIDLSVGSLMGLAAVAFGLLWRDAELPIVVAASGTLLLGGLAGLLNGLLITRLRLPPLIVTLGTFSLFRGLAEGLTRGVDNFTSFPACFLFLGQGYLLEHVPTQLPLFVLAACGFWWLLHQAVTGRALFAIGLSPEGARYAGIPVERKLLLVYGLSGLVASLAAIVYVSHLGQAKADAGTGYELMAITAVVLGGTSIFGGRGTILGTLLGLAAIVILQNGLRLAALPSELAGILIGGVLLVTIAIERLAALSHLGSRHSPQEEFEVKNSQVAVICGVILLAALIVSGSNIIVVRTLARTANSEVKHQGGFAPMASELRSISSPTGERPLTIAMMPKSKGNAYFIACRQGAEEAARELGINLIWDGPTDTDPAKQNEIIEAWITRGVDVIAVAVENRAAISSVLRKARDRGIKVITWDADAETDARDFLVNQATPEGIGTSLMDHAGRILNGQGEFAIITASLTAANQIEWQKHIEARRLEKFPNIKMAVLRPCDDRQDKAFDEANTIMNSHPNVKLIMAICSPAVPGAAEAVKQSRRSDVKVIGLGLPNDNKPYVHAGITDAVVLWNTMDLGYLTIYAAKAVEDGRLKTGDTSLAAGRLNTVEIAGDNILLGQPLTFTKSNIDQFDF
jgi:ribose/xylose/arabinose/galactoside ABC-type transport system permease subunit/ABC-type sugar transport system substrate-binding protein